MREVFPEKVMFEPNIMDMKKQVIGRNKGKNYLCSGNSKWRGFRVEPELTGDVVSSVSNRAEFLSLTFIFIFSQITVSRRDCTVHCERFRSTLGLYPPDARSISAAVRIANVSDIAKHSLGGKIVPGWKLLSLNEKVKGGQNTIYHLSVMYHLLISIPT